MDEGELTGRLIAKVTFKNTEQPKTSWVKMFQKVVQILYAKDKATITKLAMSEEENIALHFNTNQDAFAKLLEIDDDIYVWINTSTQSKLSILNRLFKQIWYFICVIKTKSIKINRVDVMSFGKNIGHIHFLLSRSCTVRTASSLMLIRQEIIGSITSLV